MRFVRWRMRGGELRRFGRDVEDGGREWLPLDQPGQVDLLCRHMNQPGQVDQLCRFAVENREQDKKSCSLFFYDKIGFTGVGFIVSSCEDAPRPPNLSKRIDNIISPRDIFCLCLWGVFCGKRSKKSWEKCENNNRKKWVYNMHNVARLPHL